MTQSSRTQRKTSPSWQDTLHDKAIVWRKWLRKYSPIRGVKLAPAWLLITIIFAISLVLFIVWALAGQRITDIAAMNADQWASLETITTVAVFAFSVGAGFIVVIELIQNTDGRNLEIYRDIYEKLMSEDQIAARRCIYTELPMTTDGAALRDYVNANPKAKKAVKDTLNIIDYFGFLAEQDWVTAEELIGWVSPIVVKVWLRIGPLVEYEGMQREKSEPDYYRSARELVKRCQEWRKKNLPSDLQDATMDEKSL